MLAASFGGNDGDSDYIELAKNSPTSPANTPDLAGHIRELEAMHEVLEGEIGTIIRPTVLFSHTNEIEITELADAETDPPKNHQNNSATLPVNTNPNPSH